MQSPCVPPPARLEFEFVQKFKLFFVSISFPCVLLTPFLMRAFSRRNLISEHRLRQKRRGKNGLFSSPGFMFGKIPAHIRNTLVDAVNNCESTPEKQETWREACKGIAPQFRYDLHSCKGLSVGSTRSGMAQYRWKIRYDQKVSAAFLPELLDKANGKKPKCSGLWNTILFYRSLQYNMAKDYPRAVSYHNPPLEG